MVFLCLKPKLFGKFREPKILLVKRIGPELDCGATELLVA